MQQKNIVEVAARTEDGLTPLGIMNAEQAQALPEILDLVVSNLGESVLEIGADGGESSQAEPLR